MLFPIHVGKIWTNTTDGLNKSKKMSTFDQTMG